MDSSARRLGHAAIQKKRLDIECKKGVTSPLSHGAVATGGGRRSCRPERAFNLDTCVNSEFLGKDGEHLAERRKVQRHHHLIELCGRDTPKSQQKMQEFVQYCTKRAFVRTVAGESSTPVFMSINPSGTANTSVDS